MATKTATGSGSTNNNGGTVINAGNYDPNGPITNDLKLNELSVGGPYGSQVIKSEATSDEYTTPNGLIGALPSGTLAYSPEKAGDRNFIIRGAGTTSAGKINGESSTLMNSLGAEFAGVPRNKANTFTGAVRKGEVTWTYPMLPGSGLVPGRNRGSGVGEAYDFVSTTDNEVSSNDRAISGTKAVPGSVTYRTGAPNPVTTNLKARDSAEE